MTIAPPSVPAPQFDEFTPIGLLDGSVPNRARLAALLMKLPQPSLVSAGSSRLQPTTRSPLVSVQERWSELTVRRAGLLLA